MKTKFLAAAGLVGAVLLIAAIMPSHAQAASVVRQKASGTYIASDSSLRGKPLYRPACRGVDDCALSGDSTAFLYRMHWTAWTTSKAVGTGTYLLNGCTPSCAAGKFFKVPIVVTFTNPVKACAGKSVRWYWTKASFRYPKGLPRELRGTNAPVNPWVFAGLAQDARASCR
jgi:hypothetical protein